MADGFWNLELGIWNLKLGIWNLKLGIIFWDVGCRLSVVGSPFDAPHRSSMTTREQ
jgi:hypothetical protein